MFRHFTADLLLRLRSVAFDQLTFEEKMAAQICLLSSPSDAAELLHPETVRLWLGHCLRKRR
jgi:hypothetical protein